MEKGITKNDIIKELSKSPHGKLEEYLAVGRQAAKAEPEFFSRLIAWNEKNGQIRDSKAALPIVALTTGEKWPEPFIENALAHLALLTPKMLLQAARFAKDVSKQAGNTEQRTAATMHMNALKKLIPKYLTMLERHPGRFDAVALQHRKTLKELYALFRTKDSEFWASEQGKRVQAILFRTDRSDKKNPVKLMYPRGSVFEALAALPTMSAKEAAGTILNRKIPFLIAVGALGAKAKEPDLVMALIDSMSEAELVNNAKRLEKLGVNTNPVLKAAYADALKRATQQPKDSKKKKASTLKTSKAVEAVTDEATKKQLIEIQEQQIANTKGIEGNWLVLGDRSPSMSLSIHAATEVAATLAKFVKGKVILTFFDGVVHSTVDATGMSLDDLKKKTQYMTAGGSGTSIGCGLMKAIEQKFEFDGIAIVSDAQENTAPMYADVLAAYEKSAEKMVPTYLYRVQVGSHGFNDRDLAETMRQKGLDLQEFDLRGGTDYYALPNIVQTMRANRWSLVDEIMETPLLTLKDVLGDSAA